MSRWSRGLLDAYYVGVQLVRMGGGDRQGSIGPQEFIKRGSEDGAA
jgi:hypothetical protein